MNLLIMKRVLSLLLLIPFLTVQAWALRGGPYESMLARSAYAGTYGVAIEGTSTTPTQSTNSDYDASLVNANQQPVVGVMTLSVPSAGSPSGRVLIFNAGLMYLGNAQGTLNAGNVTQPAKAKMTLLQQLSHYTVRTASNGVQKQGDAVVDLILSGPMIMEAQINYFTGIIELNGTGKLYKYLPMMREVQIETVTETQQTASPGDLATVTSSTTTTQTTTNDAGETTTNTTSTQTTTQVPTTSVTTTSGKQTQNFNPASVRQPAVAGGSVFMELAAVGFREDANPSSPAPFTPPSDQTFFQIDIPLAATTGGGGGGNTGGGGGAGGTATRTGP
jgi:hypothetical protein